MSIQNFVCGMALECLFLKLIISNFHFSYFVNKFVSAYTMLISRDEF